MSVSVGWLDVIVCIFERVSMCECVYLNVYQPKVRSSEGFRESEDAGIGVSRSIWGQQGGQKSQLVTVGAQGPL